MSVPKIIFSFAVTHLNFLTHLREVAHSRAVVRKSQCVQQLVAFKSVETSHFPNKVSAKCTFSGSLKGTRQCCQIIFKHFVSLRSVWSSA